MRLSALCEPSPRAYSVFPGVGRTPKLASACHGAMSLPLARPGSVTRRRLEARREELEEGPLHMLRGTLPGGQTTAKNPAHDPLPSFPAPAARNLTAQRITSSADGAAHLHQRCCFALPPRPLRLHRSRDPFISAGLHKRSRPPLGSARPCPSRPCPARLLPPPSLFPSLAPSPMLQGPATPAGGTHPGDSLGVKAGRGAAFRDISAPSLSTEAGGGDFWPG